jgi:hypothetical protein
MVIHICKLVAWLDSQDSAKKQLAWKWAQTIERSLCGTLESVYGMVLNQLTAIQAFVPDLELPESVRLTSHQERDMQHRALNIALNDRSDYRPS